MADEIDPAVASTTPALTTLPPATPGGNASCGFDSLTDLVERVVDEWAGYNISVLVETCPGVCELVYGSGNPDISGIGVSRGHNGPPPSHHGLRLAEY